jgi:hypothetical protein
MVFHLHRTFSKIALIGTEIVFFAIKLAVSKIKMIPLVEGEVSCVDLG